MLILKNLYDGDINYLDLRIGGLFNYLKKLNIQDNTLLIITSDHGENFGEHHLMGHLFCLYDELLRVPLVIRYPKIFHESLRIKKKIQLIDVFPTILDIVGINWKKFKNIQGKSLISKKQEMVSRNVYAELALPAKELYLFHKFAGYNFDVSGYARRLKVIRTDKYKYIWASDGRDELYDIQKDPGELNNLILKMPERVQELKKKLFEWLDSFKHYRGQNRRQIVHSP